MHAMVPAYLKEVNVFVQELKKAPKRSKKAAEREEEEDEGESEGEGEETEGYVNASDYF